jgi:glycerophosphoryl diester phosphodiesterase
MKRRTFVKALGAGLPLLAGAARAEVTESTAAGMFSEGARKSLVAHRGASAYAPEHTLEAYRMAIRQGADYVEQDLQITRDGVLVCLHDLTLNRTTNVEEVFPDRFKVETVQGKEARQWYVSDFTLREIKRLDAGSWFDPKYKGVGVPTWQEAIDEIKGKAGLYPETKGPETYGKLGFDRERLVLDQLKKNGLDKPTRASKTPVIIQSFSEASLKVMASRHRTRVPLVQLVGSDAVRLLSEEGLREVKKYAAGIGPAKALLLHNKVVVERAHALDLSVTPYTFRSGPGVLPDFKDVREEMAHYLYEMGVDAVFTDNPDLFPRR